MKLFKCLALAATVLTTAAALGQSGFEEVLYKFCSTSGCKDGAGPYAGLVEGFDGNFYGTTYYGGANGWGSIFKISRYGELTSLYSFTGGNDGANPQGGLTQGTDGTFYGTTYFGGANRPASGTIFKVSPSGALTTLYSFCATENCVDGANPAGTLVQGTDGYFYGDTQFGGAGGWGEIFKVSSTGAFQALYSFKNTADGSAPEGGLLQALDGNFYGTATGGGAYGNFGSIFKVTAGGTLTPIYNFHNNGDGVAPSSSLIQSSDGNLYGTARVGGNDSDCVQNGPGCGTVFELSPSGSFTLLHTFSRSDGAWPYASLIEGGDSNFYGTTCCGGNNGDGTVFQINSSGQFNSLYSFTEANGDGDPSSSLIQTDYGSFLGTAQGSLASQSGSVYEFIPSEAIPAPVQVELSPPSISYGSTSTINWYVLNASSLTLQQCYAFIPNADSQAGSWEGKQTGTYNGIAHLFSGSSSVTPTAVGLHAYALTCGGQESGFATLSVTKAASLTTVTATPNPAAVGQSVTLKATVTGSASTPSGTVTFMYGKESLATIALSNGVGTYTASTSGLPPGTYVITATYSGNSDYDSSTSANYAVTLNKAQTVKDRDK